MSVARVGLATVGKKGPALPTQQQTSAVTEQQKKRRKKNGYQQSVHSLGTNSLTEPTRRTPMV